MLVIAPGASGSAPVITPVVYGTLGANGWYTSDVTINWTFDGAVESTTGCEARTIRADTSGTTITCSATRDGFTTTVTKTFKVDKTLPSAAAIPERGPDANGWYNRPLPVSFAGTDATSGVASCSSSHYKGPDSATAAVAGFCTDNAGHVVSASFAFKYDATAPTLFALSTKRGNRSARVSWRKSSDTVRVEVFRAPGRNGQRETAVYRGSASGYRDTGLIVGRKYEYRIAGIDRAANRAERKVDVVATGPLLSPVPADRVASPPRLAWTAVEGASYYNLQVFRGRKVLSAWPTRPGFPLRRTWIYNGRQYTLRPGVYRWYVWPGYGRRSAARYGRLLGSSSFVVVR
jgi:hypothetical protein